MSNISSIGLLSQAQNRRKPFSGKTDVYGDRFLSKQIGKNPLLDALQGLAPFDVTGQLINDSLMQSAMARLERYRKAWAFYYGNHWQTPNEDGEEKPVANFCKKVVDVGVDWFVADGWRCTAPSGNEQIAELLDICWEYNQRNLITEKLTQFGATGGDSFLYVTLNTLDQDGNKLPIEDQTVALKPLDPAYCFPFWNPLKPGEMVSILIQFPYFIDGSEGPSLYSLYITADSWTSYIDGEEKETKPNPFGEVNVVHWPNLMLANSVYGQSDIHHVIPLNEEYNLVLNTIRKIIRYHAEPTTLIFGSKASDLEKGAKKVWSNLNVEGRVENLELQSDLNATFSYLDRLEKLIQSLSSTPKMVLDSEGTRISNTSGLAMEMMFQPILEKTKKRRITHIAFVKNANRLILKGHELLKVDLKALADDEKKIYETGAEYTSPLPKDDVTDLDTATKKIALKIWSRAEAQRQLSGTSDLTRLTLEVASDEQHDLAEAFELARANAGLTPNSSYVFLSSSMLSEDFQELAKASQKLEESSITASAPKV